MPDPTARDVAESWCEIGSDYGGTPWCLLAATERATATRIAERVLAGILAPMLENAQKIEDVRDETLAILAKAEADGVVVERIRAAVEEASRTTFVLPDSRPTDRRWWKR